MCLVQMERDVSGATDLYLKVSQDRMTSVHRPNEHIPAKIVVSAPFDIQPDAVLPSEVNASSNVFRSRGFNDKSGEARTTAGILRLG